VVLQPYIVIIAQPFLAVVVVVSGAVLVLSSPPRLGQEVGGLVCGLGDQPGEEVSDLVAGRVLHRPKPRAMAHPGPATNSLNRACSRDGPSNDLFHEPRSSPENRHRQGSLPRLPYVTNHPSGCLSGRQDVIG
jgi:hypothetical protein